MTIIDVEKLLKEIPKSAIMTIKFLKADGTTRTLNGRRGVKSGLVSDEKRIRTRNLSEEAKQKYVIMYEMNKKQYRNVNKETIYEIRANGTVYK